MRLTPVLLCAPLAAWIIAAGQSATIQSVSVEGNVPDFSVQAPNGSKQTFSSLKKDTTVIVFIATRCPVSNAYNERMIQLYKDYSSKGVGFVFVNANQNEPPSEVLEHANRAGFPFPVYKDPDDAAADLFGAQVTPETYIIDRTGKLRYHGAIDDSQNPARIRTQGFRAALNAVLAGTQVQHTETKAFGCTIKRSHKAS